MKDNKKQKNKGNIKSMLATAVITLFGFATGYLFASMFDFSQFAKGNNNWEFVDIMALPIVLVIALYLQIIIHEAGHFIAGIMSGYKFCSFRVGSFMWVKMNGKLKLKRLTIAGTGGQCLLAPPDLVDGRIPVMFYNLAGALINILASGIAFSMYWILPKNNIASFGFLVFAAVGVFFALLNGIPLCIGGVNNDGLNAFSLRKEPEAMRSFWIQMKANEYQTNGIRLKDMPAEWFVVPGKEKMKNSMVATLGVFASSRLIDENRFEEAGELIDSLLEKDSGIEGIHRTLLQCDRIYIELLTKKQKEVLEQHMTKEVKKFMKAMKKYPTVIRTGYAYVLLAQNDAKKAEGIYAWFEKCMKSYPYEGDIQSERELMNIAKEASLS